MEGEKEVKTMSMRQKRLNKMKLFDKRQQELLIETETIELRLELREAIEWYINLWVIACFQKTSWQIVWSSQRGGNHEKGDSNNLGLTTCV